MGIFILISEIENSGLENFSNWCKSVRLVEVRTSFVCGFPAPKPVLFLLYLVVKRADEQMSILQVTCSGVGRWPSFGVHQATGDMELNLMDKVRTEDRSPGITRMFIYSTHIC